MRILLAASDLSTEPAIVQAAESHGLHIVRRCLDAVDLAAAAAVERDLPIVISVRFPRLARDVVLALHEHRLIALARPGDDAALAHQWGITDVVSSDLSPEHVIAAIREHLAGGVWSVPGPPQPTGTVIAVTSAAGAPGRTSTALALARHGKQRTCLIDADHQAPAAAFRLGIVDDISGLALAVRHVHNATLTESTLRSACARIDDQVALLSGCVEASPLQVAEVITVAATAYDRVILDTPPYVEKYVFSGLGVGVVSAWVVVMTLDDLSVARTVRMLTTDPLPNAVIAVTGVRRRRALHPVRQVLRRHGLEHCVVAARDIRSVDTATRP